MRNYILTNIIRYKYFFLFGFIFLTIVPHVDSSKRPEKLKRKFISEAVENFIFENKKKIANSTLADIYENCYPNTLDTTVEMNETENDTFIITGDIEAMWLRDSSFQVFPYLDLIQKDEKLKKMVYYLVLRQSKSILIDPYANAFNKDDFYSPWQNDKTYKLVDGKKVEAMNKKIWERKYELDSLVSTLFISVNYINKTNDFSLFENKSIWLESLEKIIDLIKKEMRGTDEEDSEGGPEYFFQRRDFESFDTLHQGRGNPVNSCGLVKSSFRNSDDAAMFGYSIPENAFLTSTFKKLGKLFKIFLKNYKSNKTKKFGKDKLEHTMNFINNPIVFGEESINYLEKAQNSEIELLKKSKFSNNMKEEIYEHMNKIEDLLKEITEIADKVEDNIYKHGVFIDQQTGEKFFAYEIDCFGNHYFIDDPGYPSLMSLPFFGFVDSKNKIYQNTRKRILSNKNPYYIRGKLGDGVSSAHAPRRNLWPLFTIMRGLTSTNEKEIKECIYLLLKTAQNSGFIHESVNIDNPDDYTRSWFAWANSFFGYFINYVIERYPHLLH